MPTLRLHLVVHECGTTPLGGLQPTDAVQCTQAANTQLTHTHLVVHEVQHHALERQRQRQLVV